MRLALIGVGSGAGGSGIGERHLTHALEEGGTFEVVAVADPSEHGAGIAAARGVRHYADTEEMLRAHPAPRPGAALSWPPLPWPAPASP